MILNSAILEDELTDEFGHIIRVNAGFTLRLFICFSKKSAKVQIRSMNTNNEGKHLISHEGGKTWNAGKHAILPSAGTTQNDESRLVPGF